MGWTGDTAPTPNPAMPRTIAWGARVSQAFRDRVCWIADALGFNPSWLMACIAFETGRTFSAAARNPASSATGLIQFMDATAKGLGTTTQALAAMTAEDQLRYVFRYLENIVKAFGPIRSLADCYMAILWPKGIGRTPDDVIFAPGSTAYRVNKGLDLDRDGDVEIREAVSRIENILSEGCQPGNVWSGLVDTGIRP
ncbi:MAG TPA: lytic transglycosylase [Parvularcula sp.]|nr:lytic transglycosylase [Parvularcula sp.]